VGRAISDLTLDIPSLYEVVPRVLILIKCYMKEVG
jgi:hypothetical protein